MTRFRAWRAVAPAILLVTFATGFTGALAAVSWWRSVRAELDDRLAATVHGIPSTVYARSLRIEQGDRPKRLRLREYLDQVGYRHVEADTLAPGEYRVEEERWTLSRRGFAGPEGPSPALEVTLELDSRGRIKRLRGPDGARLSSLTIEPPTLGLLAGPEPRDQDPVPLEELPPELVHAFLAIEDLRFFEHRGDRRLDPSAIVGEDLFDPLLSAPCGPQLLHGG